VLFGLDVNGAKPAKPVQACIRPERILVHLADTHPAHNSLAAVVTDVIYFGDHLRLRCTLPGQADASVKIPLSSNAIPQVGQSVWLHLPPEHLRIYL
jgi:putative spermidine/putrescine transport system ATP-binding protein